MLKNTNKLFLRKKGSWGRGRTYFLGFITLWSHVCLSLRVHIFTYSPTCLCVFSFPLWGVLEGYCLCFSFTFALAGTFVSVLCFLKIWFHFCVHLYFCIYTTTICIFLFCFSICLVFCEFLFFLSHFWFVFRSSDPTFLICYFSVLLLFVCLCLRLSLTYSFCAVFFFILCSVWFSQICLNFSSMVLLHFL